MPRQLSLISWMGGKQRLVKRLLTLVPEHTVYCEVFSGGAALLLNKPPSHVEILNDIDGNLVNLFMVVRDRPKEFQAALRKLPYSRELYEVWRQPFLQRKTNDPADAVERAVRFYYVIRSAFFSHPEKGWRFERYGSRSGKVRQHTVPIWSALTQLDEIAARLRYVYIDHVDFRRCIRNWDTPHTFFYCVPCDTSIRLANETLTPICRIKKGDKVIDGKVLALHKRSYNGELVRFRVMGLLEPLEVTPDHPILAVKKREIWSRRQRKPGRPNQRDFQWVEAGELEKGDYVAIRCFGESAFNAKRVSIAVAARKHGRLAGYKRYVEWNKKLFRFFGYYLAEGHIQYVKGRPYALVFSFGKKEHALQTEVVQLSERVFGRAATIRAGPIPSVAQVWVGSRPVAEFVLRHCGAGARNKKCSTEIMSSNPKLQLELLKTWLLGDGGIERSSRNRNRVRGTTTSYAFSHQLYQITLRNGLVATHRRRAHNFDIVISNNRDLRKLSYEVEQGRAPCVTRPVVGNHILAPILRIERHRFIGTVWNLTTEKHRLITNYVETHNCDPPYYGATSYVHTFTEQDHKDLAETLRYTKGKWLLTYNDTAVIRKFYSRYPRQRVRQPLASYKPELGEARPRWSQLLIRNYELPKKHEKAKVAA